MHQGVSLPDKSGLHICFSTNQIGKGIPSWICRTDSLHSYVVMLPDHVSNVVPLAKWGGTGEVAPSCTPTPKLVRGRGRGAGWGVHGCRVMPCRVLPRIPQPLSDHGPGAPAGLVLPLARCHTEPALYPHLIVDHQCRAWWCGPWCPCSKGQYRRRQGEGVQQQACTLGTATPRTTLPTTGHGGQNACVERLGPKLSRNCLEAV